MQHDKGGRGMAVGGLVVGRMAGGRMAGVPRAKARSMRGGVQLTKGDALLGLQHRPLAFDVDVAHA